MSSPFRTPPTKPSAAAGRRPARSALATSPSPSHTASTAASHSGSSPALPTPFSSPHSSLLQAFCAGSPPLQPAIATPPSTHRSVQTSGAGAPRTAGTGAQYAASPLGSLQPGWHLPDSPVSAARRRELFQDAGEQLAIRLGLGLAGLTGASMAHEARAGRISGLGLAGSEGWGWPDQRAGAANCLPVLTSPHLAAVHMCVPPAGKGRPLLLLPLWLLLWVLCGLACGLPAVSWPTLPSSLWACLWAVCPVLPDLTQLRVASALLQASRRWQLSWGSAWPPTCCCYLGRSTRRGSGLKVRSVRSRVR